MHAPCLNDETPCLAVSSVRATTESPADTPGGAGRPRFRGRSGQTDGAAAAGPSAVRSPGRLVAIAGVLWLAVLGAGFYLLAREEFTPAAGHVSGPRFPPHSALALSPDLPTLILFAHPHCPCTRATLHELDALLAARPHGVAVTVVFALPQGVPPHWEQGDLWRSATHTPGVRVVADQDGREARRFGVRGSGHTLLYSSSGDLMFSGGITPSRGHEGDNPGRSAIVSLVSNGRAVVDRTPVFGCPLLEAPATSLQQ